MSNNALSRERIHELMLAQQHALWALMEALPADAEGGDVYQPLWDATQAAVWAMEAAWKSAMGYPLESHEVADLKLQTRCAACGCPEHRP